MARPRYPSDEARVKTRPHVRIHLTVASHRKTAAVWANLEMRAMLVELWRIAGEAYASKTENRVVLSPASIQSITGRQGLGAGLARLRRLCGAMSYPISTEGRVTFVTIRNFAKKQSFDSARRVDSSTTPHPSELRSPNSEVRGPNEEEEREQERPSAATESAKDLDPERLVNLLSKEPGDPQAKLAWLKTELPVIELLAAEDHPGDPARLMAAIRSRVLRHYRQHRKRPQANLGHAPPAQGSRAERRERAQRLYSLEQLLPEPTEEALERWEAKGSPKQPAWWLPEEDRMRLRLVAP